MNRRKTAVDTPEPQLLPGTDLLLRDPSCCDSTTVGSAIRDLQRLDAESES